MISQTTKVVTIYVNGAAHDWPKDETITYEQVVTLEVPDFAQHPEIIYSVKYTRGHGNKPEGVLNQGGEPVKVKEGMVFSVSPTGQS
jgi:multiubiquitin